VLRFGHQREVIVLAVVITTARADVDSCSIAVLCVCLGGQALTRSGKARRVDRAGSGVEPEEIGATNKLVELPILDHLAGVEIGNLPGNARRPAGCLPLAYRSDRGVTRAHRLEDALWVLAGGTYRAGAGDDDSRLTHRRVGIAFNSRSPSRRHRGDDAARRSCSNRRSRRNWRSRLSPNAAQILRARG